MGFLNFAGRNLVARGLSEMRLKRWLFARDLGQSIIAKLEA